MSQPRDEWEPRPELLAAYVDGELGGPERARVEAFLAEHPEAAADVEAQRGVLRLCQHAAPPTPSESAWAETLARVEAGLGTTTAPAPGPARRLGAAGAVLGLLATAAAVLLALFLARPPVQPVASGPAEQEPLPVASAEEVHIETIDDADRGALVVGEPPVRGPLVLLEKDEVKVSQMDADEQGRVPQVWTGEDSSNPMIVMPPTAGPGNEP
jgi:anti-sigma-K factor RskA